MKINMPFVQPAPKSLKEALMRGLTKAAQIAALVAVAAILMHWLSAGQDNIINADRAPGLSDLPTPVATPSVLQKHADTCWTSSQKAKAQLPGAAIIRWNRNGKVEYVKNTENYMIVDSAFAEVLSSIGMGKEPKNNFEVVALCI